MRHSAIPLKALPALLNFSYSEMGTKTERLGTVHKIEISLTPNPCCVQEAKLISISLFLHGFRTESSIIKLIQSLIS
jgi:hypothetical protein